MMYSRVDRPRSRIVDPEMSKFVARSIGRKTTIPSQRLWISSSMGVARGGISRSCRCGIFDCVDLGGALAVPVCAGSVNGKWAHFGFGKSSPAPQAAAVSVAVCCDRSPQPRTVELSRGGRSTAPKERFRTARPRMERSSSPNFSGSPRISPRVTVLIGRSMSFHYLTLTWTRPPMHHPTSNHHRSQ